MHPEVSLVLLTVLSSAGQGLFILTILLDLIFLKTDMIPSNFFIVSVLTTLVLQITGITASTFHLGKPVRGWMAISMWKNSWLSREIISISLFTACAFIYGILYKFYVPHMERTLIGLLGIGAAFSFFISSSMVYASIRFIKEWSNGFTPINFILFGITAGFALGLPILLMTNTPTDVTLTLSKTLIVMGVISFLCKSMAFKYNANIYHSIDTKSAVGINNPNIKLMDMGTTYEHFNTKEFHYFIPTEELILKKKKVIVITFILPIMLWILTALKPLQMIADYISIFAVILMIRGLITERFLFFAEGNHIQNLYYGNFKSYKNENPLLISAKKGTPLPN
ncbi:MAG: dimethyl sulfoxide reductase anchor subunit [Candidatus Magnetoovum sp. WYHC-5]|nr:dimethyl sulfoxide reductase anchor subunit [Candidatus Magnetoovum sp. WYHC-5]